MERFDTFFPEKARRVMELLQEAGYEAHFVGGCVRDYFLKRNAHDFDLTTDAPSNVIIEVLRADGFDAFLKGGACGTVGAKKTSTDDEIEITPYRAERGYYDHRHPTEVVFVKSLAEDLARRDFTVNSLAVCTGSDGGMKLTDLFGGMEDMSSRLIRCVGDARERFEEDALRILRALRFSVQLSFDIEEKTSDAIREKSGLLSYISGERKSEELRKLFEKGLPTALLREFPQVFSEIVGNFSENSEDFSNGGFCEVLFHLLRFRDIVDVEKTVSALKLSGAERTTVIGYKKIFDQLGKQNNIDKYTAASLTAKYGYFFADYLTMIGQYENFSQIFDDARIPKIVSELDVGGNDMIKLGFSGSAVGEMLTRLLCAAILSEVRNKKEYLCEYAKKIKEIE